MATIFPSDQVIVVGGGLAGFSAANTVLELGGRCVMLDKSAFCGGNSTKATSGINGANTRAQQNLGIKDSVDLFESDCLAGGAKKPDLVKVLTNNSGNDVNWLVDVFSLDLSLLARLGGHSVPRTHRGKERFPGMTITYALIQMFEKVAERCDKAVIITKANVTKLIQNQPGDVVGCEYTKGGQVYREFGSVILATGGFGADFTSDSLLAKHRPDLMHLPTTNGEHCTGDGIKMGEKVGARTIDLEWVQVHPTGLVKPEDADAKIKFLAAEALRGVGGLVLDANGKRFANELGRRDYVTGEMWKNKAPFRLVLNKAASDEIIWHCKHYTGRGVMKYYASGRDFAKDIGVPLKQLEDTHQLHYEAAKKHEADPDGGPYPAYPSGKSWDEPSGLTGSGKKFYHNIIPGSAVANEPFYVAVITPVIHYCMGGLEITTKSELVDKSGKKINGLYAAGEVMGGVHGNNRLGGNSLLDCVVFGRVAGRAAAEYQFGPRIKKTSLKDLSGGGLSGDVAGSKVAGGSYEDNMNQAKGGGAAVASAAAAAEAAVALPAGYFTMEEVAKHTAETDCWVIVAGQVLDVTSFLKDHPGGSLAILTFAGKDATEEFNMIHPPDVIGKYAPDAVIGKIGSAPPPGAFTSGGGSAVPALPDLPVGQNYYSKDDVAKHSTEADCWVIVDGQVLDVTSFLKDHPGGSLAILTFAGKDATEEFNMIHPPDVIGKYAPGAIIGRVGSAPPPGAAAAGALTNDLNAPLLYKGGDPLANEHCWGDWREIARDENPGALIINFGAWYRSVKSMAVSFMLELVKTIFSTNNFKFTNDRTGLTRSAIFLIFFMVIHAVGNLHVFGGPDDFNGYGYFYVRLYWSGFGLPMNIIEEYVLLCAMLHVMVGLKRTWDISLNYKVSSGKLNLAISGVILLVFMIIHLFQFRFGDTDKFFVRPPRYMINFGEILRLRLFWTQDTTIEPVPVRDIYKLEFDLFKGSIWWTSYYLFSVIVFVTHACLGWQKLVPAPAFMIPKGHVGRVQNLGYIIFIFVGLCYFSFPIYTNLADLKTGDCYTAQSQCAPAECYDKHTHALRASAELVKIAACRAFAPGPFHGA